MKKHITTLFIILFWVPIITLAQSQVERVEPLFWWADMPVQDLQIMLYGDDLGSYRATTNHEGIRIDRQIAVDSPNYLFLYLTIDKDVQPGNIAFQLSNEDDSFELEYELRDRKQSQGRNGFSSSDVIYLMMPDRFANGDPTNDEIEGMLEGSDRLDPNARHGGDIAGVMEHLDYIDDLGMTAIWFTPVFENDMKPEYGAYHGYAATDLYKIDRRFGSNDEFIALVDACHNRGMKVIMDMIHNHIGDQHWWMDDVPTNDWFNSLEKYGTTNYRGVTVSHDYASEYDKNKLVKGWFVNEMPDLNQDNPLVADYLIQNTLWWIEYSNIDGIRMDTYVYPEKEYMARWSKEVLEAYPDFNIVGEAWVNTVAHESYWQYNHSASFDGYNSHLPSVTDFPMEYAIRDAFSQDEGWLSGLAQIYYTLAQDHLYTDPQKNVIFLDNHDLNRFYDQIGREKDFFKMAYAYLMTTRGIPQVYYGTELMFGEKEGVGKDGAKRPDMPGGWEGDERSVFTQKGRTKVENEVHSYVTKISNWRKDKDVIHNGKLLQFLPQDGVYVFFRYNEDERVMVILNKNDKSAEINREKHIEMLRGFSEGYDVMRDKSVDVSKDFKVPGKTTTIIELK